MTKHSPEHLDQLRKAADEAKAARDANPCAETREAYKQAWQALSDASPYPLKKAGYGGRAGQRQAAERAAMRKEALRRAARR